MPQKLQKEMKVTNDKYAVRMLWDDISMHLTGKRNMVLQKYNLLLMQFEIDQNLSEKYKTSL